MRLSKGTEVTATPDRRVQHPEHKVERLRAAKGRGVGESWCDLGSQSPCPSLAAFKLPLAQGSLGQRDQNSPGMIPSCQEWDWHRWG